MNWSARLKNKTFWLALASAIVLLIQQIGFDYLLPDNIMDIVNTVLLIFTILGVVVDPTTSGIKDGQQEKEIIAKEDPKAIEETTK